MKPYKRRAAGKPEYFKLAVWDSAMGCWRDGKRQFDSEAEARTEAVKPGKYRVSKITTRRTDLTPFVVE